MEVLVFSILVAIVFEVWELYVYIRCRAFYNAKKIAESSAPVQFVQHQHPQQPVGVMAQPMGPPPGYAAPPTYASVVADTKAQDVKWAHYENENDNSL